MSTPISRILDPREKSVYNNSCDTVRAPELTSCTYGPTFTYMTGAIAFTPVNENNVM